MRVFFASICAVAFAAFIVSPAPAKAADAALTGQMASFNYLLGAPWSCTTSVPAMQGMPAHTEDATVTFEVAPHNVFHDHISGAEYMADDYFGYSTRMNNYWTTSADNRAAHGFALSTDGKTYTGTNSMGTMTMNVATTYTQVGPNKSTMHEIVSGNGEQMVFDSTCTR